MKALISFALGVSLFLSFFSICAYSDETPLGEVVLHQGAVFSQPGSIKFKEWSPGEFLKTNPFRQYRGPGHQTTSKMEFKAKTSAKPLQLRAPIGKEEIITTGPASYVRLLLIDDSIVDLGPESVFAIERFDINDKTRNIQLKLLKGKIRILVTRKLEGQSSYHVSTPGVLTWVRGTDFIIHTEHPQDQEKSPVRTTVIGVRGQVSCDLVRIAEDGHAYHQPYIIHTYSALSVNSADGYALSSQLRQKLSPLKYSEEIDHHSPFTDPTASVLGKRPLASQLPGTGIPRQKVSNTQVGQKPVPSPTPAPSTSTLSESLEAEHPDPTLQDALGPRRSGNFLAPFDYDQDPSLVNHRLGPVLNLIGPDRTDRLPYQALQNLAPIRFGQ